MEERGVLQTDQVRADEALVEANSACGARTLRLSQAATRPARRRVVPPPVGTRSTRRTGGKTGFRPTHRGTPRRLAILLCRNSLRMQGQPTLLGSKQHSPLSQEATSPRREGRGETRRLRPWRVGGLQETAGRPGAPFNREERTNEHENMVWKTPRPLARCCIRVDGTADPQSRHRGRLHRSCRRRPLPQLHRQ